MIWKVEFTSLAIKQLSCLDRSIQARIKKDISTKLAQNPDFYLKSLLGDKSDLCKFCVGNYRLLCKKDGEKLIITVVKVAHRKEVYH